MSDISNMENCAENLKGLECILTEKQLHYVLTRTAKSGAKIINYEVRSPTQGLAGFLGNHLKLTLHVKEDFVRKIHLFVKALPTGNQPKSEFIKENNFNKRESLVYQLFEEMGGTEGPNPWRAKAFISTENILVMPDLCKEGYKTRPLVEYFDKNHVMLTVASMARFHATFCNYVTKRTINENKPYNFLEEYGHIMNEPTFLESPWLYAAAKLTSNFLKELSTKSEEYPNDLEKRLINLYIKACESLKVYEDTLNVIVHKDLWVNNILFRYTGDVANNAVLIDYQCMSFVPPAFDIMVFLYFTTSKKFREDHEREVLDHYYSIFSESLDDDTKQRLDDLNYNHDTFLKWCEKTRFFGIMEATTIMPFVLMDPVRAQKTFDDPETFMERLNEDRCTPVIEHARENIYYRNRLLEVCEEFVERYILDH